mmetsp:Transcript_11937/g.50193  ORF Transcript_11937/g.50193 Transcript_11937/m.50193 type:complete len:261 (+) Transcript_11937:580-1362(+)
MRSGPCASPPRASPLLRRSPTPTTPTCARRGTGTARGERSRPDRRRGVPSTRREAARVSGETERVRAKTRSTTASGSSPPSSSLGSTSSATGTGSTVSSAGRTPGWSWSFRTRRLSSGNVWRGASARGRTSAGSRTLAPDPFRGISSRWRRPRTTDPPPRCDARGVEARWRDAACSGPGRLRLWAKRPSRQSAPSPRRRPRPSRGYAPGIGSSRSGDRSVRSARSRRGCSDLPACWRSCDGRPGRSRARRRRCGSCATPS